MCQRLNLKRNGVIKIFKETLGKSSYGATDCCMGACVCACVRTCEVCLSGLKCRCFCCISLRLGLPNGVCRQPNCSFASHFNSQPLTNRPQAQHLFRKNRGVSPALLHSAGLAHGRRCCFCRWSPNKKRKKSPFPQGQASGDELWACVRLHWMM